MSCECPTSELPGEAAAGKEFAQGGDHPSPPSLTPHFPGASIHRHQFSRPAPAVVLAPQALRTTASATCIYEASVICEAGKCRPEDRQCFATGISRLHRWWYAIILPPYAAGVNPAGSVEGVQEAAVPAAGADSVGIPLRYTRHRLRRSDNAWLRLERSAPIRVVSRSGSGR